jgi:hypothetical protein
MPTGLDSRRGAQFKAGARGKVLERRSHLEAEQTLRG